LHNNYLKFFFVCYRYNAILISKISISTFSGRLDNHMRSNIEMYHTALTNPAEQYDCRIYYFDKITLTWITKRVDLMMLTLRDRNSDGLEMPASLGSLTIHFRHMTERRPFGWDGIGSSFACHITHRSVIARG